MIDDLTFFDDYKDWPGITGLIRTESHGEHKNTGKVEQCNRYYISSKKADARTFDQDIRSHRAIENKLHRVLDVTSKKILPESEKEIVQRFLDCFPT